MPRGRGGRGVDAARRRTAAERRRAAGDSGLAGQIVEVTYYGDRLECAIRIDGAEDQIVVVNAEKRQSVAAGDRVFLGIDTARVKLWPI